MKKLLLLLLILQGTFAIAQKKELLLTLKAEEEIDTDNTKIITGKDVVSYQIVTEMNRKHYLYTKTEKGKIIGVDRREGEFITTGQEDGKEYFRVNPTNTKYGPMEELKPRYDEDKQILYGYTYKKDGMNYFVDLIHDKTYGPLLKGGLWYIDEKNLVYSYARKNEGTNKDEYFLVVNEVKHGPYEQVTYHRSVKDLEALIIRKENGDYYVNTPKLKNIAFATFPIARELKNGWMFDAASAATPKIKKLYLPDGTILENSKELKHIVNYNGDVLKLEFVAGGGTDAAYKISYKGKTIGTYAAKKSHRSDQMLSDFFDHNFMRVDVKDNYSLAYKNENYLFSSSRGLIGPFTENEVRYLSFFDNGYAVVRADSTLEINGEKKLDKIIFADFKEYPETWWAFQQRGDYVYPFKNGVEVPVTEQPKRFGSFNTTEKEVIKVQRGNDFYLRVKGSDKLLGPIDKYSQYAVSKDGKHYAAERGSDGYIVINGKPIAKGFNVTYDEKTKTFYWFIQEGLKIYMYSYKVL